MEMRCGYSRDAGGAPVRPGRDKQRGPLVLQVCSAEQKTDGGAEVHPQGADPDLLRAAGLFEGLKGAGLQRPGYGSHEPA